MTTPPPEPHRDRGRASEAEYGYEPEYDPDPQGREPRGDRHDQDVAGHDQDEYTTALPRPSRPPVADYQETTVLRRPAVPPGASNVPGADRSTAPPDADRSRPAYRSSLPPYSEPEYLRGASYPDESAQPERAPRPRVSGLRRPPRKLTVTRVAALRSRELTHRGLEKFHGAVSADGADLSGLGHLTYAVMGNYAVDAALAVALANTLFFAAATAESTGNVLLYLLLTVAPFAIIAPLVGPALDKLQHGRRIALAASSLGRAALAVVMALNFDSWIIYPCALGMLVLSKGFGVLKASLAPRVLPPSITLVKTNSRLSVFGLIAGGIAGGIAAGIAALTDSSGALWFTAACGIGGAWLCLRIPSWVESTEGETPIHHTGVIPRSSVRSGRAPGGKAKKRGMPHTVVITLWANSTIRISTGFLGLFVAFVIKIRYHSGDDATAGMAIGAVQDDQGWMQLLLLGAVGAAAGLGGFVGNALGARLPLRAPDTVALTCLASVIAAVIVAVILPGLVTTSVVAFVASTASSLAKVCLDATIQSGLPETSRASAFGRSESVLQLSWVFGGVVGLLIGGVWALGGDVVFRVGFGILALLLALGAAQAVAVRMGGSLLPHPGARTGKAGDSGAGRAGAAAAGAAATGAAATGAAEAGASGEPATATLADEPSVRQAGAPRRAGGRYARTPSNATGTPRRTRKLGGKR